jgi:hypothetical protein
MLGALGTSTAAECVDIKIAVQLRLFVRLAITKFLDNHVPSTPKQGMETPRPYIGLCGAIRMETPIPYVHQKSAEDDHGQAETPSGFQ